MRVTRDGIETDHWILKCVCNQERFECRPISQFGCGERKLNKFLKKEAFDHTKQLFAQTYILEYTEAAAKGTFIPVAFVSLCNDAIKLTKDNSLRDTSEAFQRGVDAIPDSKRIYKAFPAVKIAQLGVDTRYNRSGAGSQVLDMLKEFFTTENRTGCRFITVDAYTHNGADIFYQKNGFDYYTPKDAEEKTRIMWFDLLRFKEATAPYRGID